MVLPVLLNDLMFKQLSHLCVLIRSSIRINFNIFKFTAKKRQHKSERNSSLFNVSIDDVIMLMMLSCWSQVITATTATQPP